VLEMTTAWKWLAEWGIGQFTGILGSVGLTQICRNVGIPSMELDELRAPTCPQGRLKRRTTVTKQKGHNSN